MTCDLVVVAVLRVRGFVSALTGSSLTGFFRVRGLAGAWADFFAATVAAAALGTTALARVARRVLGLIVVPVPGRMVFTGILA